MGIKLTDINLLTNLKKRNLIYIVGLLLSMFVIFSFMLLVLEFFVISKQNILLYKQVKSVIQKKAVNDSFLNFDIPFSLSVSYKKYSNNKTIATKLQDYKNLTDLSFIDFIKAKFLNKNILKLKTIEKNDEIIIFKINFSQIDKIFNKILLIGFLIFVLLIIGFILFLKNIYYIENTVLKSIVEKINLLDLSLYDHTVLFNKKISELEKIHYFCRLLINKVTENIQNTEKFIEDLKKSIRKMNMVIPFSDSEKELLYQKDKINNIIKISDVTIRKMTFLKQLFLFKTEIEREINVGSVYLKIKDFLKNIFGIETFVLFEVNVFRNYRKVKVLNGITKNEIVCLKSVDTDIYLCKAIRSEIAVVSDYNYKKCTSCNMNRFKKYDFNYSVVCIPFSINKEWDLEVQIYAPNINTQDNEEEIEFLIRQVYSVLSISKSVLQSLYLKEKLENYSFKDGLTQLYNRRFLETKVIDYLNDVDSYCVIIFDIDHFKKINDAHGHDNGDIILKEFANILNAFTNENHNFYAIRYGGEEFVVVLLNEDCDFAFGFAQRIKEFFASKTFTFGTDVSNFSVSGGVSCYNKKESNEIKDFYTVLKEADQALYYSKNHGRNRISIWKTIKEHLKEEEIKKLESSKTKK